MTDQLEVTIYHTPACGTSRNTLALIRNAGVEPTVIEYLKNPPDRERLHALIAAMGSGAQALLREKEPRCQELAAELGIPTTAWSDDQRIEQMLKHPCLINRPVVTTPWGTRLCRPSEVVLEILPIPQKGAFAKEDGEHIINAAGQRLR